MRRKVFFAFVMGVFFFFSHPVFSKTHTEAEGIKVFRTQTGELLRTFSLPKESGSGISLAAGDLGSDGLSEIVLGAGKGAEPRVFVYTLKGELVNSFLAYGKEYQFGVRIALGDLDGDGKKEILTGTMEGGGPQVRIFDGWGKMKLHPGFFAFEKEYLGGIHIASGDLNQDGKDEILVSSGRDRAKEVKVFNERGEKLDYLFNIKEFFGLDGARVKTVDLGGDGQDEVILAGSYGDQSDVFLYRSSSEKINSFRTFDPFLGGVNISPIDFNNDGKGELLVSPSVTGSPMIKIFDGFGKELKSFFAGPQNFRGGLLTSAADIDNDGIDEIIAVPERVRRDTEYSDYRLLDTDISEQKLRIMQNGYEIHSFLISSGKRGFDTPQGEFSIFKKREKVRMTWYYGDMNLNNYDLPNVPHVLSFSGPYTIHGTYWHNNFGHPMSHGCINASKKDAAWLYAWTPIGTKVVIHE